MIEITVPTKACIPHGNMCLLTKSSDHYCSSISRQLSTSTQTLRFPSQTSLSTLNEYGPSYSFGSNDRMFSKRLLSVRTSCDKPTKPTTTIPDRLKRREEEEKEEVGLILSSFAQNEINWMTSGLNARKRKAERQDERNESEARRPKMTRVKQEREVKREERVAKAVEVAHISPLYKVVGSSNIYRVVSLATSGLEGLDGRNRNEIKMGGGEPVRYQCLVDECHRIASAKDATVNHIRRYFGNRPFVCPTTGCGVSFERQCDLDQHENRHSRIRPFGCSEPGCGSTFESRGEVTLHATIHGRGKPFVCNELGCCASFSRSNNLRRHKHTHKGIKPFCCGYCGKGFARSDALGRHRQSMICDGGISDTASDSKKRPRELQFTPYFNQDFCPSN